MLSDWARFGDADRFEVSVRWIDDPEPRERRPAHGGWSAGELRLKVGGVDLTRQANPDAPSEGIRWYLFPFLEWIARNWLSILHEERFAWRENTSASAATATFLQMRRLISSASPEDQDLYDGVHAWWSKHALRAADPSALYPDLFIRRLQDDIEVSWTARQPSYAPDGFRLDIPPGVAMLAVDNVAMPLWEVLAWAVSTAVVADDADKASLAQLASKIANLSTLTDTDFSEAFLPKDLWHQVVAARAELHLLDHSITLPSVPAMAAFDDAVLMFGGVSPEIDADDATTLLSFLQEAKGHQESTRIMKLVDRDIGLPIAAAYTQGYDLAEQLLEELYPKGVEDFVDIEGLLDEIGVSTVKRALRTNTIRGAAVAGSGYTPAILVNATSSYNRNDNGERFTLAHELFHILYDRRRAKTVAHTSGPWAAPGIEKRANAFAAMLLMPRKLLWKLVPRDNVDLAGIQSAARSLRVGSSTLIEHLYNTDFIDELRRDELRINARSA